EDDARREYERIADAYPGTETAIAARRLATLLDDIAAARTTALSAARGRDTDLSGGLRAYINMDYDEAETALEDYLDADRAPEDEAEARYYLGRSFEERGRIDPAIEQYDRVIWLDEEGRWATEAGRRLVMISAFYDPAGSGSADPAQERPLDELPIDEEFQRRISPYQELVEPAPEDVAPPAIAGAESDGSESGTVTEHAPRRELWLRSEPPGAQVRVGETSLGRTPIILEDLNAGPLEVTLEAGRGRARETLEVPSRGRAVYDIVLDFPEESPPEVAAGGSAAGGALSPAPEPLPFDSSPVPDAPDEPGPGQPGPGRLDPDPEPAPPSAEAARLLERIEARRAERDRLRRQVQLDNRRLRRGARISLGLGSVSAGASGVLYLLSRQSYNDYQNTDTADDAVRYREQTIAYSRGAIAGAVAAGVGLLAGTVFTMLEAGDATAADELRNIEQDLELLQARYERLYGEPGK
ncbi:MAG: tetratricopeptide repeat protein, partial [Spirochaetes bacterium]|nr:tetratricopeptide repeat protein [Spirochaetota bacterium]